MTKNVDFESSKRSTNNTMNQLKKPRILRRTWVTILVCFASTIMVLLRYNLSVAIIAILEEELPANELPILSSNNTDISSVALKKYPFTDLVAGQILASYFYGYTLFQLPAGRLSELFGSRWILGPSVLLTGILSLLTPLFLEIHYLACCIARFIIGSLHCAVLSCTYTLFSEWLPDSQKSTALTFMSVAFEIGGVLSFYLAGIISTSIGWQWSFYLFSLTAIIWFVPYYFLVYSSPDSDPYLSQYEKKLVEEERKNEYQNLDHSDTKMIKIPPKLTWKILLSPPVLASACAKSAIGFAYYVITIEMPQYLHVNFGLPIEESGAFTSIAESCCFAGKLLCLPLTGYVFRSKLFSLTVKRKIFQSIAFLLPAIGFLIITMKSDSKNLVFFLLCVSCFGLAFVCLGDAAITAEGILTPVISSAILEAYPDDKEFAYNCVFYLVFIFLLVSFFIFLLFATSKTEEWAKSKFVSADEIRTKKEVI